MAGYITQIAAAWVLSCVFARFLEDNQLVEPPRISGQALGMSSQLSVISGQSSENRLQRARDEHELYFRRHPTHTDREYLLWVFSELRKLPACRELFDPGQYSVVGEEVAGDQLSVVSAEEKTDHCQLKTDNFLSGDAGSELLKFFQKIDADTGRLIHDFTDPEWDTRFLGDLYQDLSEAARKKYALLQTPEFVEEFILDRTLEPAIEEFGLVTSHQLSVISYQSSVVSSQSSGGGGQRGTDNCELTTDNFLKMIDPACGSGHFLLGSFARLLDRWQRKEPGTNVRLLAQRALDSVHGVDVNPYAVAIARFRLLLAAMKACGIARMVDAPAFRIHVACGDSLIHGVPGGDQLSMGWHALDHVYQNEDREELYRILKPGHYHAVVANPPYITPKDRALNTAYRERYSACHMKYSLSVPFMQRIFNLAVDGGYTGQITANSFMKREFGKKLIEEFLPRTDLTHVIDTSGAYIPGHGTPTVILFGRHGSPMSQEVRAVLGIRGEPSTPDDPAQGKVWRSIVDHVDQAGSKDEFTSVTDTARGIFAKHPWSMGGGGSAELKELIDSLAPTTLTSHVSSIGPPSFAGIDDMFFSMLSAFRTRGIEPLTVRPLCNGDVVRDWQISPDVHCIVPYDQDHKLIPFDGHSRWGRYVWLTRRCSEGMISFNRQTRKELGEKWWSWYRWIPERFKTPLSIAYAEVATHNHFVLDHGGKVFKQTAPIIKLPSTATEDDHLALLGLLNSSTACFWMKQVFHNKGSTVDDKGARQTTVAFENFYQLNGTGLQKFPIPSEQPLDFARDLNDLSQEWQKELPPQLSASLPLSQDLLNKHQSDSETLHGRMIALQEELDWKCYRLYDLLDDDLTNNNPPPIQLGQRAFEIVMARKMAAGELETTWFERHSSTPIIEIPVEWPEDYKQLVERRIELIQTDRNIGLIEQPEYKRRWNTESWASQLERALRGWLLDRLESYFDFDGRMKKVVSHQSSVVSKEEKTDNCQLTTDNFPPPLADIQLLSLARLTDVASQDPDFMQVAALYRNDPAFDVQKLVTELVEAESVPLLPVLRYKPSGLRKRAEWERTWELQREEDRRSNQLSVVSDQLEEEKEKLTTDNRELITFDNRELTTFSIPVPPKYTSGDFQTSTFWRLRGKLDVPKERWVSFPYCEGEDGTLMIAWAGYDHLQLARAISAYYVDVQERLGGRDDPRLVPLLAGLIELLPWLKQWHNDVDPEFGMPMGDYFESFIQEEARQMAKTLEEVRAWQPPQKTARRRKKA